MEMGYYCESFQASSYRIGVSSFVGPGEELISYIFSHMRPRLECIPSISSLPAFPLTH